MRSRQAPIPTGRPIDEMLLFDLAKNLLSQVDIDGRLFPCANLSLSVGSFEDGPTGNKGIGGFLVRGEEAKALASNLKDGRRYASPSEDIAPAVKRRKTESKGIDNFFMPADLSREPTEEDPPFFEQNEEDPEVPSEGLATDFTHAAGKAGLQSNLTDYFCPRCKTTVEDQAEHEDWHFAKDLQAEEQQTSNNAQATSDQFGPTASAVLGVKKTGKSGTSVKPLERGQKKLAFG